MELFFRNKTQNTIAELLLVTSKNAILTLMKKRMKMSFFVNNTDVPHVRLTPTRSQFSGVDILR